MDFEKNKNNSGVVETLPLRNRPMLPVNLDVITPKLAQTLPIRNRPDTPRPKVGDYLFQNDIPNQDGFIYYFDESQEQFFDNETTNAPVSEKASYFESNMSMFGRSSKNILGQAERGEYSPVGIAELELMDMETDPSLTF